MKAACSERRAVSVATVTRRLVWGMTALAFFLGVVGVGSMHTLDRVIADELPKVAAARTAVDSLTHHLARAQLEAGSYAMGSDPADRARFERSSLEHDAIFVRLDSASQGLLHPDDLARSHQATDRWFTDARHLLELPRGERAAARHELSGSYDAATASIERLRQAVDDRRDQSFERLGYFVRAAYALIGLSALLAVIAVLLIGRRLRDLLVEPLERLRDAVGGEAAFDSAEPADDSHGPDEVRALARTFNRYSRDNGRLHAERARALELHEATSQVMGMRAYSTSDREEWDDACRRMCEALRVDRVVLFADDGTNTLQPRGSHTTAPGGIAERSSLAMTPQGLASLGRQVIAGTAKETRGCLPRAVLATPFLADVEAAVLQPMYAAGRLVGFVLVASLEERVWTRDEVAAVQRWVDHTGQIISEHGYIAQLRDLDEQKSNFVATTSHELRTPLTSIAGYLELLDDGDFGEIDGELGKVFEIIGRNVARLRSLIEDLLIINRLDSGRRLSDDEPIDLQAKLVRVTTDLRSAATRGRVELELQALPAGTQVAGDREQIARAFTNVIGNAVKFTPAGGRVVVSGEVCDEMVTLTVRDTGIGIPAADQGELFTQFFRASNAQSEHIPGTGLGLVIVKTIIESHDGHVWIDSVEGEGTTVTMSLPLLAAVPSGSSEPGSGTVRYLSARARSA